MKAKNIKWKWLLPVLLAAIVPVSCNNEDEELRPSKLPIISFENTTGIYTVKIGKTITIEPFVENDENAMYSWTAEGKILSTEKILTYSWNKTGQVFITFKVLTDYGSADEEIRVDVAELVPPKITLSIPKNGYTIVTGQELILTPVVDNNDEASYSWTVDSKEVSKEKDYTFKSAVTGAFHISLKATNEDGEDTIEFDVHVKLPSDMPFSWSFENTTFHVSQGRIIRLLPFAITNAFDATYTWTINDTEVQKNANPLYAFKADNQGTYSVKATMKNSYNEVSHTLTVKVCPPEGTYKRVATGTSVAAWNKVYEFLPAPGQFVNEDYTVTTMAEAVTYAEGRLRQNAYVSLGGFGGYIVLGFDHSIENDGGYNFQVMGNSFQGSSEPGIVWVMQDENGDGLPNDTWYELKGSEYGKVETIQDYEITYYRPRSVGMPVSWTDNRGKSGTIDYLAAYHRQDYYYPLWVKTETYTLRGTCLKSHTRETSPGYWSNDSFEWGYVDNFSSIDRLTDDDNYNAGVNANHFKISDAVTFDGKSANLQYIDFIKVQTGVNTKAGWLGENSTEVFDTKDFNMIKK
ncbi:MAG: PKD domain-containing protein [Bacteroidales bacterium]|jgi:hypothetical protein|nr:PKD domain-containing protein [Bacteroidales bacterium]